MKVFRDGRKVRKVAERLEEELAEVASAVEIAGSLRRGVSQVGDIELVMIEKPYRPVMGEQSPLEQVLSAYRRGRVWGRKMKNFVVYDDGLGAEIGVDLFITAPAQWGWIFCLRTGPATFTKALVTDKRLGGLKPPGIEFKDGWVLRDGVRQNVPQERDFFWLMHLDYMQPADRETWTPETFSDETQTSPSLTQSFREQYPLL